MTSLRPSRATLWLLLVAALFMHAVMPQGYMTERNNAGAITVQVCGSGHLVEIPLGKGDVPGADDRVPAPCAFAGLGTPALPPPAIAEISPPAPVESVFAEAGQPAPVPASPRFYPPARGPPLAV